MIKVTGDLKYVLNKIEKFPIVIESAVAESLMASEVTIRQDVFDKYGDVFQDYTIETNEDLSISISLNQNDVWHYQNITGSSFDDLRQSIKNCVTKNIKKSLSKNIGEGLGS